MIRDALALLAEHGLADPPPPPELELTELEEIVVGVFRDYGVLNEEQLQRVLRERRVALTIEEIGDVLQHLAEFRIVAPRRHVEG